MASLPTVGGDSGTWGTILNTFLQVSLDGATGNMLPAAVAAAFTVISTKTSNYGPGAGQGEFVLANATSGAITITLPTAVSNKFYYGIKKVDSSTNTVTFATTSSQTIDGGSTAVIKVQYASITLVSDGSNWNII
jgi:hypothetical protein